MSEHHTGIVGSPPLQRAVAAMWAESVGALRTFTFWALPMLVGFALSAGFQLGVLLPKFGTGSLDIDRCVEISKLYQRGFADQPTVVFIGDSVSVEGIDAAAVAINAPSGWRVINAAINNGDRIDQAIMAPALAKARPEMVVWVSRPMQLGAARGKLNADRAAAYRVGDFTSHWSRGWLNAKSSGLSPELMEAMEGSRLLAQAHFHTWLLNASHQRIRAFLRRGAVRMSAADEWDAPYQMITSISGVRLEQHLEAIKREHNERLAGGRDPEEFAKIIRLLADAGVRPVVVLAPIHPRIRERGWFDSDAAKFKEFATELAASTHGLFLDASALLDAEDFADGQHPGTSGRAKLSEFIGRRLPPPGPDNTKD